MTRSLVFNQFLLYPNELKVNKYACKSSKVKMSLHSFYTQDVFKLNLSLKIILSILNFWVC